MNLLGVTGGASSALAGEFFKIRIGSICVYIKKNARRREISKSIIVNVCLYRLRCTLFRSGGGMYHWDWSRLYGIGD